MEFAIGIIVGVILIPIYNLIASLIGQLGELIGSNMSVKVAKNNLSISKNSNQMQRYFDNEADLEYIDGDGDDGEQNF